MVDRYRSVIVLFVWSNITLIISLSAIRLMVKAATIDFIDSLSFWGNLDVLLYSPYRKIKFLLDLYTDLFMILLYFVVVFSMMEFPCPRLILLVDFMDANSLLAGVLNLKGFKVSKSNSVDDFLSIIARTREDKIDVALIDKRLAVENDFYLVNQIRKKTADTMIVVIGDNADEDEKLVGKNIDGVVLRPTSPENLADKILNMLARKELKRLKEAA
jgi:CheY-like chemotaxis protein